MFQSSRYKHVVMFSLFLVALLVGSINVRSAPLSTNDVRGLQQTLLDIGYWPGPIDGILGSRTRTAIRQYQGDENLPVTGWLDADTARKVEEARHTRDSDRMKFQGMDADNNGVITRQEYSGNDKSFANHDWNGDGSLSGEEIRPGAHRPGRQVEERSVGAEFKQAGRDVGHGSQKAGHEMEDGKPVASGKEFGKGVGRFGKSVGRGVKKAADPDSDGENHEKKEKSEN
jgi:Putative peptidoglycan binding domain